MTAMAQAAARVGPNAIIQTVAALRAAKGGCAELEMLTAAGLSHYVQRPPAAMLDEGEAARLFSVLFDRLPRETAGAVAEEAGQRTANYIIANRIPRVFQRLLGVLPRSLGMRMLLSAIARHAWTFAGSGRVTVRAGHPSVLEITANPLAMPGCHWHRAVFEHLFRSLVSPHARVRHTACCRSGAAACRFEIETE